MLDKIFAMVSLAAFISFTLIILVWINEIDLWVITVVVLVMAVYDFTQSIRKSDDSSNE